MSEAPEKDQQTEAPTEKRKRDAAEKGDVLQSRELGTALVLIAGAAWMALAGPWFVGSMQSMLADGLSFDASDVRDFAPADAAVRLLTAVVLPLVALFTATLIAAVASAAMLGSLGFRSGAFAPKFSKLNPISGLSRIFGAQGLVELAKSLAKVVLLGVVGYKLLVDQLDLTMGLAATDPAAGLRAFGDRFLYDLIVMVLALAAIAGLDIPAQFLQRLARLRMSKQELKEEHKQTEGSPELKGAIRRRQHEMARQSARGALREATVVLTNPTHFAVALRYRPGMDAVPVVVARGRGVTAQAIRELAGESSVPVLSYPQLTRAIYYTTRTGHAIREDLYVAVATILAFVFNLDAALARGAGPPEIEVPPQARFDESGRAQV